MAASGASVLVAVLFRISWLLMALADALFARFTAAFALATALYPRWLACRMVTSCSFVGGPDFVGRAKHLRLSDLCGPAQFLHLVAALHSAEMCIVDLCFRVYTFDFELKARL